MENDNNVKIELIIKKLNSIDKKIDTLVNDINEDVKPKCNKMSSHIDFIEKVYSVVKSPLGFMCERISFLSKNKTYELDNNTNDSEND
tara:strand:- start:161 stop:424 length:264 start_codon:yes stop_codon:yes gene_type:complete